MNVEKLKDVLEQKNISQKEFAQEIGTSEAFVSNMLRGFKLPSLETTKRISKYLDIPINEII